MPNNVGDLGKIIVATGFKWLPNVQKIAQTGPTGYLLHCSCYNVYICVDILNDHLYLLYEQLRMREKQSFGG